MLIIKYKIFLAGVFLGVPALIAWLVLQPRQHLRWLAAIYAFSLPFSTWVSLNFFPDKYYRGTARGMETTITDLLTLAMLGAIFLARRWRLQLFPPGWWTYALLFLAGLLSLVNAANHLYSLYEIWKMIWMWGLFLAVFNYLQYSCDPYPLFRGLAVAALISFAIVIWQKYVIGIFQTTGPFAHQNSMGMFFGFCGPLFLSLWLEKQLRPADRWLFTGAFLAATGCVFATLSRGAIFFFPFGCLPVVLGVFFYRFDKRKAKIFSLLCLVGLIGLAKMGDTIIDRFTRAPQASANTRIYLARAARNMANDKKLGVGINNWGIKINPPYDYAEHREEKRLDDDYKDAVVETIYMLTAAECGWWGLGMLLLFFGYYFLQNAGNWYCARYSAWGSLALALAGGLLSNYGQSVLEWVLKQTPSFYALMMCFALVAFMTEKRRRSPKKFNSTGDGRESNHSPLIATT